VINRISQERGVSEAGFPAIWKAAFNSIILNFEWVCRREKSVEFPEFPEIEYELGWRNTVIMNVQQSIISEVRRISFNIDPKIWLGIKLLPTYIKTRPGEMRNVRERDIYLESGFIHIPLSKEGSNKRANLLIWTPRTSI